ncbi:MAG: hypothetical protein MPJ78_01335 [Hyphomicrobiaceae bacterium]|nr:hypothetical protein [Hyphomicrobiaceae bacterium]
MSRAKNTCGELPSGRAGDPALLGVQALPEKLTVGGLAFCAVFAAGLAYVALDGDLLSNSSAQKPANPKTVFVSASDVQGAFFPLPSELSKGTERVFGLVKMPKVEKERLSQELKAGNVRIAAIWLWDNQAQDGDAVQINSGGFSQTIAIANSPTMYYVPVQTGTNARITAVADGGGGVTLGVKTIVGPFPLPPLVVGQSLEVPVL